LGDLDLNPDSEAKRARLAALIAAVVDKLKR